MLALIGSVLLWTLLILLGLLALLLLLLLFVPFRFRAELDTDLAGAEWEDELAGTFQGRIRLRWGLITLSVLAAGEGLQLSQAEFRLMGFRVGGQRRRRRTKGPSGATVEQAPSKAGPPKKKPRSRPDLDLILTIAQEAAALPGKLWRSLGVQASGNLSYGFSDPSLTGFCEAFRWGARLALPVTVRPDFLRPCLVGWAKIGGRVFGYKMIAIGWRVLRRPAIWNHLVGKIRLRPLRNVLLQGGT